MGIALVETKYCTGCGTCEMSCPLDVIRVDRERNVAYIAYLRDCQSCYLCAVDCPEAIIKVTPYRERRIPLAW